MSKAEGGMGFRNMEAFNKTLLVKQAWFLVSQPDTLLNRALEAKYFPNDSFLNAQLKENASYVWRSLLWSRLVMEKESRWCIGMKSLYVFFSNGFIPNNASGAPIT